MLTHQLITRDDIVRAVQHMDRAEAVLLLSDLFERHIDFTGDEMEAARWVKQGDQLIDVQAALEDSYIALRDYREIAAENAAEGRAWGNAADRAYDMARDWRDGL